MSFLACAFGAFLWSNHTNATPECDGEPMAPGDTCTRLRSGSSWTYEETKASLENSIPVDKAIFFVSGAIFILSTIVAVSTRGDKQS